MNGGTPPARDRCESCGFTVGFNRTDRGRIARLHRLAAFIERKALERYERGEPNDFALAEVQAIRWALSRLGAKDQESRAISPTPPS